MERNQRKRKRPTKRELNQPVLTNEALDRPWPLSRRQRARARDPATGRFSSDCEYKPDFAEQAFRLCLVFGGRIEDLTMFFDVDPETLGKWRREHPEFDAAIRTGGTDADAQVAASLFRRALGYNHKAVKVVADANTGKDRQVEYTMQYPPDTTACIFWLKNRQRRLWRDRWELQHSGTVDHTHRRAEQKQLADLSPAELMQLYRAELEGDVEAGPVVIEGAPRRTEGDGERDPDKSR